MSTETQLDRIERKLDALISALAEDDEPQTISITTLDGDVVLGERDQTQSLD